MQFYSTSNKAKQTCDVNIVKILPAHSHFVYYELFNTLQAQFWNGYSKFDIFLSSKVSYID